MHKTLIISCLSASLFGLTALGQDNREGEDTTTTSQTNVSEVTKGILSSELVAIRPQVGVLMFRDPFSNANTSRFAAGFTTGANIIPRINPEWNNLYIGPETGLIYTHLGDPGTNLLGAGSTDLAQGNGGANMIMIPANLKLGYNLGDNFRLGFHGGGNILYRSVASALFLGPSSGFGSNVWSIFPNAGADVELGLAKNVALSLRPDLTITPGDSIFTGTLALNFLLS